MIKAIIVEDEQPSTTELIRSLAEVAPHIEVVGVARSVEDAVKIITQTPHDLIFMDIHLDDGNSFEIFNRTQIAAPVIFITAYDQYALLAFKNQGIDYLLKPFSHNELSTAINKLGLLSQSNDPSVATIDQEQGKGQTHAKPILQERFLVNIGSKMRSLSVGDIAYFMAEGKYLYLCPFDGGRYIVDDTITSVIERLSPQQFFQINRKFIINFDAIKEMIRHSSNRIKVILIPTPPSDQESVVSAERVQEFRSWLNR